MNFKNKWICPLLLTTVSVYAAEFIKVDDDNADRILLFTYNGAQIKARAFDISFQMTKKIKLSNGLEKEKYAQFYKGIPVLSGFVTSSKANQKSFRFWGNYLDGISADISSVKPKLSEQMALDTLKKHYQTSSHKKALNEQAKLYIIQNKTTSSATLVYWVSYLLDDGKSPSRPNAFVDANSGKIIRQWNGLTTKEAKGPGGNTKTGAYYYSQDFGPLEVSESCEMRTDNVETYNLNGRESGAVLFKFNCPENTFKEINGAYSPLNDAHYFGNVVFKMFKDWYGISPLTNRLKLRVHYGQNYENAFWDGEQMTFGDGASRLYPLTSLDVVAHEVSHGVTEQNSNLIYQYQSGGINEAFSDMAGEVAEFYMNESRGVENDWMVGASIIKGASDKAMRYFANPSRDGYSIEHAKDYRDSLDVHFTSGVYNKAFYTLVTKHGWDIKKAFEVFLVANQVYWQPDATYDSAACGVKKAAEDLGYGSQDVVKSFDVVGVDADCDESPNPVPGPGDDEEKALQNGEIVYNLKLNPGDEKRFLISVPALPWYPYVFNYLSVQLFNNTSNANEFAELYLRYDKASRFEVGAGMLKNSQFLVRYPEAGNYHILLKGKKKGAFNLQAYYGY